MAKLPGGGRTIKSLPRVCRDEQLPEPSPLQPGERRMLGERGLDAFVATLANDQVVPRRKTARKTTPTDDAPAPMS